MMNEFAVLMGNTQGIMIENIYKSVSNGEWDIIIGTEIFVPTIACISSSSSSSYQTPSVILGLTLPVVPHLYPPWPFPTLLQGAVSADMGFVDRALKPFIPDCNCNCF